MNSSGDLASMSLPRGGFREVANVPGDQDLGLRLDRGRQHVVVVRVRQVEAMLDRFVALDETVADGTVHELACAASRVGSRSDGWP